MKRGRKKLFRDKDRRAQPPPASSETPPPLRAVPQVTLIDYTEQQFTEHPVTHPDQCLPFRHSESVT
jgi:hypothetical protein